MLPNMSSLRLEGQSARSMSPSSASTGGLRKGVQYWWRYARFSWLMIALDNTLHELDKVVERFVADHADTINRCVGDRNVVKTEDFDDLRKDVVPLSRLFDQATKQLKDLDAAMENFGCVQLGPTNDAQWSAKWHQYLAERLKYYLDTYYTPIVLMTREDGPQEPLLPFQRFEDLQLSTKPPNDCPSPAPTPAPAPASLRFEGCGPLVTPLP